MNTANWKWFLLTKVFDKLQKCKCSNATELLEDGDDIAYIGAKKGENGVMKKVRYNKELITTGNCIVLIGDGQGSVGYSIYQPKDFIGSTTLIAAYSKHLNSYTALFLVAIIDQERYRYSFGRKFNKFAIGKTKIKLPATADGNPDWQYMEDYAKNEILPNMPAKARSVWEGKYSSKPMISEKLELRTEDWEWFTVGEIFDCNTTVHSIQNEMVHGDTPFVSRSAINNGISDYVTAEEDRRISKAGCITIGAEGIFAFYQPKDFVAGVKIYTIRATNLNKYNAMFICTILNKEAYRYNYGNARILDKIKKEKIKLPATTNANGEKVPDWQWMEDYIKGLPFSEAI